VVESRDLADTASLIATNTSLSSRTGTPHVARQYGDRTIATDPAPAPLLVERLRARYGHRAAGILVALALEALLILLLLTLGQTAFTPAGTPEGIVSFDVQSAPAADEPETRETEPARDSSPDTPTEQAAPPEPIRQDRVPITPPVPRKTVPAPAQPVAIIPLSRRDMAQADLADAPSTKPEQPAGPAYGPSMAGAPGDTEVVGRAPNGEPLYAARWYREPGRGELSGYLSTASGPGWALIACRTAPGWRVEDCVGLDEYPGGSNIQRAVLAAAWQFQVRPPVRSGQSLVGSWVRIRIDYERRP